MIISCPNCNKQFKINTTLIPVKGRDLKCGSCDHVWFYNLEDNKFDPLPLNNDFVDKVIKPKIDDKIVKSSTEPKDFSSQNDIDDIKDKKDEKISKKQIQVKNKIKKSTSGRFFSYLIVSIISFVGLIILVDTLKIPLISIFPGLEVSLFNLFEILKDIKLFIIDLY